MQGGGMMLPFWSRRFPPASYLGIPMHSDVRCKLCCRVWLLWVLQRRLWLGCLWCAAVHLGCCWVRDVGWSPWVRCRVVRCRVVGCVSSPVQPLQVLGYLCHRVVLRWLLCEPLPAATTPRGHTLRPPPTGATRTPTTQRTAAPDSNRAHTNRSTSGLIRWPLWCLLCCLLVWRGLLSLTGGVHSLVLPARGAA